MSTITIIKGHQDPRNNYYISENLETWADKTNWSTWTRWNSDPDEVEIQIDDDLGATDLWVPTLRVIARGALSVTLKTSNTGAFAGEEETYSVTSTPTSIASARYYRWTINASSASDPAMIQVAEPNYVQDFSTQELQNVSTASLSGTITARTVSHRFGQVFNCQITTKEATPWVDRFYAAPDDYTNPTNIAPVPGIVSKNPLTICLRDEFGVPVDGYVDLSITGAPQVYLTTEGVVIV